MRPSGQEIRLDAISPDKGAQTEAQTAAAEEAEGAYQRFVETNLPRNYAAHFLHGMLGMTGFRLVNAPTFVPAYLHSISGSDAWVGLGAALQQLGSIVSPIAGASVLEHRRRVLPVSVTFGLLMRLQILGLALAGWFLTGSMALTAALTFLFLLGLFQGPQRVAFQYLMAKVIPVRLRGRLNAWRNLTGGLIAAAMSWTAGVWLVAGQVWGNGYATTFFVSFVLTSLGLMALQMLMREPEPPNVRARVALKDRLRDLPGLLRDDRGFMWFMVARSLAMGARIGQPFFFLYAAQKLGVSAADDPAAFGGLLALFSIAFMGADTVMNLVWGYLADRGGFRSIFLISCGLYVVSIGGLMMENSLAMAVLAFMGIGAAQSAYLMASTNIVLEYGGRDDMAMRMALSNTAEGLMGAMAPIIGALLVTAFSYQAAFGVALAFSIAALLVGWKLMDEPRRRKA